MDPQAAPTAPDAGQNSAGAPVPAPSPEKAERLFTQAQLEATIEDRLKRQKAALEATAAQERSKAEAALAAQQGNYQAERDLAVAKVAELEPLVGRVTALETVVSTQAASIRKALPADLAALEPEALAPEAALAWLLKAQTQAGTRGTAAAPGTPGLPPRGGAPPLQTEVNARRQTGGYRF